MRRPSGNGGGSPALIPMVSGDDDFGSAGMEEEVDEDVVMCGGGGGAGQRKRRLSAEQVRALERSFEKENKLEPELKARLARDLGLQPRQVAVWFQNRRARWKSKQLEHDFDTLRAAHHELLAGRDALLADNDRLRSQVISLTERLQAKESSPASEPEEQTAASATVHADGAAAATRPVQLKGGYVCDETDGGGAAAVLRAAGGYNDDSPESYFAETRSPPSSSEDDCGDGGCTFFLPDAIFDIAAVERESVEEPQMNYWSWFWN